MTLKDAKVGQTFQVKKLTGEGPVKRRIMDMGITKGTAWRPGGSDSARIRAVPAQG